MRPSCKRMPTKLCMMVEAGADHPGVPALLWLPVVQGLLPFNCQSLVVGRGSTQEPPSQLILFLHGCHNLYFRRNHESPMYFALFAETTSPIVFWFFRQYHVANVFWWRFWTWRPCRRTSIIWRCIVDFFVSYLICMFQDSVPAGSLKWSILV